MMTAEKIIIAGFGNPLLCDDTAGHHTVDLLETRLSRMKNVTCKRLFCGGIGLVEELASYTHAFLIDCFVHESVQPGDIVKVAYSPNRERTALDAGFGAGHGIDLTDALALGNALGYAMPRMIVIYGIGGTDVSTFALEPQEVVRSAIGRLAYIIERDLVAIITPYPEKEAFVNG